MLVGVELNNTAVPPVILNLKSPTSNAPLPELVLYTFSFISMVIVLLSDAIDEDTMIGSNTSDNTAKLFDCVVSASFPALSYMPSSTGLIVSVSPPLLFTE